MNTPVAMYWSSTAEPWLPQRLTVAVVFGSALTAQKFTLLAPLPLSLTVAANLLPSGDIHAPDQDWLVVVSVIQC